MKAQSYLSSFVAFCMLSGCATSPIEHTIISKGNKALFDTHNTRSITSILGKSAAIDIVFYVDSKDLHIDEVSLVNQSGKSTYQSSDEKKYGCLRIEDNKYRMCRNEMPRDAFITGDGIVFPKYTQNRIDYIFLIINYSVHNELKEIENSKNPEKLEQFITKYKVTDKDSPVFEKLISMYREKNDFDSYIKSYKITDEKADLRNAYNVAKNEQQKHEAEVLAQERQEREMRALAGAAIGAGLVVGAIKWLFDSIGSGATYSSSSSSGGGNASSQGYARIEAEMVGGLVAGLYGDDALTKICVSNAPGDNGGTAYIEDECDDSGVLLLPGYQKTVSGLYNWTASFGLKESIVCSGTVNVGSKNMKIRVYKDCSDAGTYEY